LRYDPYIRSMDEIFLTLEGVTVQLGGERLLHGLDWTIRRGEQWAVVGSSGSGKTVLAHTLMGRHFSSGRIDISLERADRSDGWKDGPPLIAMVEQQHRFRGQAGSTELYYQQRFNAADADKTITVEEELTAAGTGGGQVGNWLDHLHVRALLKKPLIQLSNGENRRVQLAIALLDRPVMLILDNPFLGLDAEGRAVLHTIIDRLAAEGIQILLITGTKEIPACITHIAQLDKGRWTFRGPASHFQPTANFHPAAWQGDGLLLGADVLARLQEASRRAATEADDAPVAVRMVNTTIRYGEAMILNNINWEVKKGERWNVSGPNGAGKSTLLSLINADNPQAYANEIWLFGRRRGTGETIWEIKKKIGFVSPELHLYFDPAASCFEVVASGLFDTIGLFRQLTTEQQETTLLWMQLLSLQELRGKRLAQVSAGQQRMLLLARALIKNPPMLILDEPCQGLDDAQTARFRALITVLCDAFDKTLLYVSHYRQELPTCIDRFLRLENGEIA
jgi:molybdate transport system ATP-binding protein